MPAYIDPHIHMISRVTDDYQRMAQCGCVAVTEPAFWAGFDRARVCIDHVEEHTVRLALDNGFWCGLTLYPTTKCTPERAVDILEMVGTERILVNSAGDWGKSNPLAVPELILEMRRRYHGEDVIRKVVYENPLAFFRQSARWLDWGGAEEKAAPKRKEAKRAVAAGCPPVGPAADN